MTDSSSRGHPKRAARPYTIVVGVVFLVVLIVAGINVGSNSERGVVGLPEGDPLPRFAAPAATGSLDGDANVNQDDTDGDGKRRTAACQVEGPPTDVVRICDFFDRPLVMVAWFTRGCGTCKSQLDTVEKVRRRFPDVGFVGLDVGESREERRARRVRENGWRFPMAVDPDGAVSDLYRVGVGPLTFFAYPGGISMGTRSGELDERELVRRVRRLMRASERQGAVAVTAEVPISDGKVASGAAGGVSRARPALHGRGRTAGPQPGGREDRTCAICPTASTGTGR